MSVDSKQTSQNRLRTPPPRLGPLVPLALFALGNHILVFFGVRKPVVAIMRLTIQRGAHSERKRDEKIADDVVDGSIFIKQIMGRIVHHHTERLHTAGDQEDANGERCPVHRYASDRQRRDDD